MTTSPRIVISLHSVRAMLAEWKSDRDAAEREAGTERATTSRDRDFSMTPGDYADDLTPYVYSLLEKHQEPSP